MFTIPASSVGFFPDIEPHFDMYPRLFDMDILIQTTAKNPQETMLLLNGFGIPFATKAECKTVNGQKIVINPFAKFKKKSKGNSKKVIIGKK